MTQYYDGDEITFFFVGDVLCTIFTSINQHQFQLMGANRRFVASLIALFALLVLELAPAPYWVSQTLKSLLTTTKYEELNLDLIFSNHNANVSLTSKGTNQSTTLKQFLIENGRWEFIQDISLSLSMYKQWHCPISRILPFNHQTITTGNNPVYFTGSARDVSVDNLQFHTTTQFLDYYRNQTLTMQETEQTRRNCSDSSFHSFLFQWMPDNCTQPECSMNHPFDGFKFLSMMKGKKLLVIGDSISEQHFGYLACQLNSFVSTSNLSSNETNNIVKTQLLVNNPVCTGIFRQAKQNESIKFSQSETLRICHIIKITFVEYDFTMLFQRNNFLLTHLIKLNPNPKIKSEWFTSEIDHNKQLNDTYYMFDEFYVNYTLNQLQMTKNDVMLLNVASHTHVVIDWNHKYTSQDAEVGTDDGKGLGIVKDFINAEKNSTSTSRSVNQKFFTKKDMYIIIRRAYHRFFALMKQHFDGTLIFRSTLHGHPGCIYYSEPWTYEKLLKEKSQSMKYHWNKFDDIDAVIIQELADVYLNQDRLQVVNTTQQRDIRLMNVSFTGSMAIGHPSLRDCFHSCVPGAPMYWWNVMLYSVLNQDRQTASAWLYP